jgi:hypothetical protein
MVKAATEAYGEKSLPRLSDAQWQLISNRLQSTPEFKSQHFDQPNILAHLRVNDRVIDGKKTLFVEEVQSDWHQAGRKRGYQDQVKSTQDLVNDLTAINKERANLLEYAANLPDSKMTEFKEVNKKIKELAETARNIDNQIAETAKRGDAVPDAPFKTTWSDLSMKRVIQLASEGGYDRIAFTTGKTQADRYDLSKQINDLTITRRNTDFNISATDKDGKPAIMTTVQDLRNLDEIVGKDLAEKVKDDFANKSGNEHTYSSLDLQVGGEGMKGFYDDILPKFLNKYAKKWDAKTGVTEIPTSNVNIENQITFEDGKYLVDAGDGINYNSYDTKAEAIKSLGGDNPQVNYIDVTPKMRESVVTKGQPMFAIGAGGAGAAATQEENK